MKKLKYKSIILLGILLSVSGSWVYATELTKEYQKEFDANENSTLVLQNQYGNIDVQNWENKKVRIEVEVIVEHSNEERAQKMLGYIDVEFSVSGNEVKAKTVIDDKFSRSGNWKNGNDFEINYTVQMPKEINLDLYNKYGHVYIDEVSGLAEIDVKYGKLTVNKLNRGNTKPLNTVSLSYSSGCSIAEANWLKANIKYSGLEMEKVRAFVGYTSYMKLSIDEASSVVIEGKYDGYKLGRVSNLVVNTRYSGIKVDEIAKKLESDTKYTNVDVGYMPATFESINIDSQYGTYKIGVDQDASYSLDGEAGYSKIYFHDKGSVSKIQENTSMKVYGTVGTRSDPKASVKINTKYGNVKLND